MTQQSSGQAPTWDLDQRLIGRYADGGAGPILICISCIHGNEPSGLLGLQRVLETLERERPPFRGELIGFIGNLAALNGGQRYLQRDLNRSWYVEAIAGLRAEESRDALSPEDHQQLELLEAIQSVVKRAPADVYFLDQHSTSAQGPPFAIVGPSWSNRAFAARFPVPLVLGLQERLSGTMTEFVADLGAVTMAFEAGQHDDPRSIDCQEAAVWVALAVDGIVDADLPQVRQAHHTLVEASAGIPRALQIRYRHAFDSGNGFRMDPGYHNMQRIEAGDALGRDEDGPVTAPQAGRLVLPLYQGLGDDGFFVAESVEPAWLNGIVRTTY
ncbi:MAG: hypothetical protein GY778_11455 [bacterium]|nr:hypothetical protein [bacterium]